jgi:ketosteroid isomerase-like protein
MSTDQTASVIRAYYDAWTTMDFVRAESLLAPELAVEVPVNEYPTVESFAAAVRTFGSMTRKAQLLSQLSAGDQGMLLYDMQVQGLETTLRVAEHFTVRDGKITRVRQVHDTAALRAAGFVG